MQSDEKIQEILTKIGEMKFQLDRLMSDAESEKHTRRRRNEDIDKRIFELEKWQAKWGGALIALGVIATVCSIAAIFIKATS